MMNHLSNNLFVFLALQEIKSKLNPTSRLAGSDTTAIALRACFYYIVKSPRVYKRLVQQIDEADRQGLLSEYITYEECLKLPYL